MSEPTDITPDSILLSKPRQDRALQALQRILSATVEIIEKDGARALSTDGIARRAKVNISTFYKYFSDKDSVVRYIALDLLNRQTKLQIQLISEFPEDMPWQSAMSVLIDTMVQSWSDFSGFREIQKYYLVDEMLHQRYRETSEEVARTLDRFKQPWGFDGSDELWVLLHVIFGDCACALLDLASTSDKGRSEISSHVVITELHRIAHSYLGQHFKPPKT